MPDDNASPCEAHESCTDIECVDHRFDLYSAMVGVADAWCESLPSEPLRHVDDLTAAFSAVARLAATEVFG